MDLRGLRLWMFFSIAASVVLASQCSPIDPGAAGQLPAAVAAPTSVHSAVQYAVLTAKQRSSECIPVGGDVLRGLLVHVAFNSCLGFPGEGLQKGSAARCCVTGRQLTDARVLLAVAGAENVPHARREVTHALFAKHGKTGECLMMVQCSCTNLPFFLSSLVHQQAAFEKNTPEARGTGSTEAASSRA